MRFTVISIAALLFASLAGCQGDDNALPAPADASAADARPDSGAPRDGGGDAAASPGTADAVEDLGTALDGSGDTSDGDIGDGEGGVGSSDAPEEAPDSSAGD
jgi:hypothetical protein